MARVQRPAGVNRQSSGAITLAELRVGAVSCLFRFVFRATFVVPRPPALVDGYIYIDTG